jgi:hypothetical protein
MTELPPRGRGRGRTNANPQQSQFHAAAQQREGRKSVPHDDGSVCMCACQGTEQGVVRETLLQTPSGFCSTRHLALGPVHAGLSLVRESSLGPGSAQAVTSLLKHCGASSSCFSLAVDISLQDPHRRSGLAPVRASMGQVVRRADTTAIGRKLIEGLRRAKTTDSDPYGSWIDDA